MTTLADAPARAPRAPGVYAFLADDGELLYAGKAADVRARLRQHAGARPASARLRRLYALVADVRWEEHRDEAAAVAREADVIVALRPRYNASLRGDGRWAFVEVAGAGEGRLELRQARTPGGGRAYGCFPHLGPGLSSQPGIDCTEGYAALLRLLWAASGAPGHYPAAVAGTSAAPTVVLDVDPALRRGLGALLSGTSARVLDRLRDAALAVREPVLGPGIRRDLAAATAFFEAGPAALRRLRTRHECPPGPMARDVIVALIADDLRRTIGDFRLPAPDPPHDGGLGRRSRPWAR